MNRLGGVLVPWIVSIFALLVTPAVAQEAAAPKLQKLMDDAWQFRLRESPLFATFVGDHRYNDRLPEVSLEAAQRRLAAHRQFAQRLSEIDRDALDAQGRINYDIFARERRDDITEYTFQSHLMPITGRTGFHISFPELWRRAPLRTVKDYENYISRLRAFREYAQGNMALMREGLRLGITQPRVILTDYEKPIEAHIVDDPSESLLYEPFKELPGTVPTAEHARLRQSARQAIGESVVPGYREFLQFMRSEYLPGARESVGASALPDGREYYRHRVRHFTTLNITPEEVHRLGLSEVKRIRTEMDEVMREVQFEGDFEQFVEFLRTDPRFYADTPEELMKEVAYVLKKMDGQLPKLFSKLPRMSYGIREIPAFVAPRTTTAYYMLPSGDGTVAGFYYVNTYDLKSRPLYEIEALSLHEAVPGHHLQLALQQEMEYLPPMRRFGGFTAFVEGWGLYAERLGLEVGFYEDPYSNFGRLSYEMWRACRLVVDSGMHYLNWSRGRAIQFMAENTALTEHNIEAEVDRYIGWPGQAVAYKLGELTFRRLRSEAKERLGEKFDLREYHDVALSSGAVPLDVLEAQIDAWVEKKLSE